MPANAPFAGSWALPVALSKPSPHQYNVTIQFQDARPEVARVATGIVNPGEYNKNGDPLPPNGQPTCAPSATSYASSSPSSPPPPIPNSAIRTPHPFSPSTTRTPIAFPFPKTTPSKTPTPTSSIELNDRPGHDAKLPNQNGFLLIMFR